MTKYNVGDKVRFVGASVEMVDMTHGNKYLVVDVNSDGGGAIFDDGGDKRYFSENTTLFELVDDADEGKPVEASPTVIELLANISRRLYEAERKIDSQRSQIDVLNSVVSRL